MNIYSKTLGLPRIQTKISLFASAFLAALVVGASFVFLPDQDTILENGTSFEEKLVIFGGNTLLPIASPLNPEPQVAKSLAVVVTAYSSTVWETWGDPFITAAGTRVREGIIANNLLPFGTKVRLPEIYGDKIFVVEDRMNSRKGNYHFDIWFSSYWEAKNFGAKRTYIEVLES
jgi:3D (Asp-Asp-Asp) domain-containing protein